VDFSRAAFSNRRCDGLASVLRSTKRIRSRQSGWPRRFLEFATYRTSAARGSECGHPHVWRSARRSLLRDLFRQLAFDETALRTSALRRAGTVLQGSELPPPRVHLYRGPLPAYEELLRPQRRLIANGVISVHPRPRPGSQTPIADISREFVRNWNESSDRQASNPDGSLYRLARFAAQEPVGQLTCEGVETEVDPLFGAGTTGELCFAGPPTEPCFVGPPTALCAEAG
jgi:hypothetical protein